MPPNKEQEEQLGFFVETSASTELQNDVVHGSGEPYEFFHGFRPRRAGWSSLSEGYAVGQLCVHVHFGFSGTEGDERSSRDYCAVYKRSFGSEFGGAEHAVSDSDEVDLGIYEDTGSEVQRFVFVPIRETVEDEDGMFVSEGIPSLVRLRSFDTCEVVRMKKFTQRLPPVAGSLVRTRVKGIIGENGIGRCTAGGLAVSADKLDDQLVQGRPKIVDDLSDDNAPAQRRVLPDLHPRDVLASLRPWLCGGFVGVSFQEPLDLALKRVGVFVGTV